MPKPLKILAIQTHCIGFEMPSKFVAISYDVLYDKWDLKNYWCDYITLVSNHDWHIKYPIWKTILAMYCEGFKETILAMGKYLENKKNSSNGKSTTWKRFTQFLYCTKSLQHIWYRLYTVHGAPHWKIYILTKNTLLDDTWELLLGWQHFKRAPNGMATLQNLNFCL